MRRDLYPVIMAIGISMAILAMSPSAAQAKGEPSESVELTPDQLKWGPDPALPAGARYVVLYGDLRKKGPYVFRVKFPPNYQVPAHSHSDDRTFTVISGTLYRATGDKFDETRLKAFPTGSFLTYRAGENFFAASRDGGSGYTGRRQRAHRLHVCESRGGPPKAQVVQEHHHTTATRRPSSAASGNPIPNPIPTKYDLTD